MNNRLEIELPKLIAIEFLHECGYIHGELKPENLEYGLEKQNNCSIRSSLRAKVYLFGISYRYMYIIPIYVFILIALPNTDHGIAYNFTNALQTKMTA